MLLPMAEFHSFYLSVDGHEGCFHILVIVSNAAMKIGVHIFF